VVAKTEQLAAAISQLQKQPTAVFQKTPGDHDVTDSTLRAARLLLQDQLAGKPTPVAVQETSVPLARPRSGIVSPRDGPIPRWIKDTVSEATPRSRPG
jgi:hypothetical protein